MFNQHSPVKSVTRRNALPRQATGKGERYSVWKTARSTLNVSETAKRNLTLHDKARS